MSCRQLRLWPQFEADSDEQFTPQANNPTYWETGDAEAKFESDPNGGAWGTEWIANGNYSLVVIKSAQTNGISSNGAQAGERLGSSFNGNNRQGISHIIALRPCSRDDRWCFGPAINHTVVLFGGPGEDYVSTNHTPGNDGSAYACGIAIDGTAQFHPTNSWSLNGGVNYITDGYTGAQPNLNGGAQLLTDGTFPYSQQAWIAHAGCSCGRC